VSHLFRAWVRALGLVALLVPLLASAAADVVGIQLLSSTRVGRSTFDYTYSITVHNGPAALVAARATVVSSAAATQIVKGVVTLGDVAAGATVTSSDTFTLRQDRTVPFNPASLVWNVSGASLDIALSDAFVPAGGSVTVTPTLRDASGNVVSTAGYAFNVTVAPVGTVTGAAPAISGLSVSFPKIVKRLIRPNPAVDPDGDFADTDPTDPNYGRQTGGAYLISVSIQGTALAGAKTVTVLPTGTAKITYKANRYASQLASAAALAAQARKTGNSDLLAQAKAALTAIDANPDFSTTVLSTTSALAPPDGGLITAGLLVAQGFTPGSQDAAFASALNNVVNRVHQAKLQLDATNTLALNQAAVDALQAALLNYKSALQSFQGLRPSTLGAYQQQDLVNRLVGTELPGLFDSIKRTIGLMLGVTTHAAADSPSNLAWDDRRFAGNTWSFELGIPGLTLGHATEGDALRSPWPGLLSAPAPAAAPASMYAATKPVQFFDFFFTTFGILTDLSGTATTNIIELSITLANSIINIELANYVNRTGGAGLGIDYCQGSASFSFVCPNYSPSTIGGFGFGRDPSVIRVALVGCVPGDLLAGLLTLSAPSGIAASINFANSLLSGVQGIANLGPIAAIVTPDYIDDDWFGGSDMLYFGGGFPRVNQGRLPCVGAVIVINKSTGGVRAVNVNFLGSCG
jgi:hypothetical protein